ncbi:hypothetical protein DV738_g3272, partial [Chaetothyriales sp. CBS 135597]
MADTHQLAARGGRPSPSTTPDPSNPSNPQQYQQYQQYSPRGTTPSSRPESRTQHQLANSQPGNHNSRFMSNQYLPAQQAVVEAGHQQQAYSPRESNYVEYSQSNNGNSSTRSRSSTINQPQNYAVNVIPSQHSAPQPPFVHGNARPVSISAGGSPYQGGHVSAANVPAMSGGVGSAAGTRPAASKSPWTSTITSLPRQRSYHILLINPNSTSIMTENCLAAVQPSLPPGIELTGYTAPYPAPTAIESFTDAIMSTEAVVRDLAKYASSNGETVQNFDGIIVACYSKHPLVDALRESYDVPVIGIMEASLYVARMLGARFGIVTTTGRARFQQEDDVRAYGLSHFYVGTEATLLGVLELETRSREEVNKKIQAAARTLANKGADTILLGCAGMTEMIRAAKDGVRDEDGRRTVNVIDGVEAAVQLMCALIGMGVPTSKKGMYKGEKEGRRERGQNWL